MFSVYCPGHRDIVLIWTSGIEQTVNTPEGIGVRYHCTCGYRGVLTGRRSQGGSRAAGRPVGSVGSRPPVASWQR